MLHTSSANSSSKRRFTVSTTLGTATGTHPKSPDSVWDFGPAIRQTVTDESDSFHIAQTPPG